jgi:hypothetical protein
MFKRKLTISDFLLITINLIPLYCVWFEGWDAYKIFMLYCLETVLIGIFNVIKMATITLFIKPRDDWNANGKTIKVSGLFFIAFFIVHYGIFVLIQTSFFFGLSGLYKGGSYWDAIMSIPQILGNEGQLLLLIFVAYYAVQMLIDFFFSGEYRTIPLGKLMFQPYGRIFVQQFVVIIGSIFLGLGAGKIFILVFVVTKIIFEIFVNLNSMLNKTEMVAMKEKENA